MQEPEAFLADPDAAAFMLDFDGTLSPVVSDPNAAVLVPDASELLVRLAATYPTVCVVSGRRAEDVASRVGVDGISYYGLYGAEVFAHGVFSQHRDAEQWRGMASRCARDAEAMIASEGLAGCEVEYKDLAVSIHHRNAVDPAAGSHILSWAQAVAPRRRMVATTGRMVVELRPSAMSKASVVTALAEHPSLRRLMIAGDDASDVEAMRAAGSLQGVGAWRVGVRSTEEPAGLADVCDLLVNGPVALVQHLALFVTPRADAGYP